MRVLTWLAHCAPHKHQQRTIDSAQPIQHQGRGQRRFSRPELLRDRLGPAAGHILMWYALAAVLGLVAGAYACLGVIFIVAPSMGTEDALLYIYPSAVVGVVLAVLAVRKFRRRQSS